jgi:hypothetical protein
MKSKDGRNKEPRSMQGRTPRQIENNYKVMEWTMVAGFVFIVVFAIGKAIGVW